jgi:pimeloyl-ACP methyl ester carboxylesterase
MRRLAALLSDSMMCAMMYVLQRRHRLPSNAREQAEAYLARHPLSDRQHFFAFSPERHPPEDGAAEIRNWDAPIASAFPENRRCHAQLFPCVQGWKAPTVLMLHALMSASDRGYREWARKFNARGWNAVFVHLPYHYSRTPRRHLNGELAITADLIRTTEGLRSGVIELRQLMDWLRALGCPGFGLWACSYGGWIGALLAAVERDFRWIALLEPITDLSDALWRSGAGRALRRHLRLGEIPPELVARFQPLVCPSHGKPAGCDNILLAGGLYDQIARPEEIRALHQRWPHSTLIMEPQGHFGFRLMRAAWRWLEENEHLR